MTFLYNVASDLLRRYGNDMSRVTVVLPNKRAGLFLAQALAAQASGPVWSPRTTTIDALFRSGTPLLPCDHVRLCAMLYQVFAQVTQTAETIDDFYGWAEVLLADFDDIDKHLADPRQLFSLIKDLHAFDNVDYLSDEQKELLSQFFKSFDESHSEGLREKFLRMWSNLGRVYDEYRALLRSRGIAYDGMLFRDCVERAAAVSGDYAFVGFKVLTPVEQKLLHHYKSSATALFYWDYDADQTYDKDMLFRFPNALADGPVYHQYSCPKSVALASAPTADVQARYVAQWLAADDGLRLRAGARTAIVMADESLLPTVLHCLPATTPTVNITSGYPLALTPLWAQIAARARELTRHAKADTPVLPVLDTLLAMVPKDTREPIEQETAYRMHCLLCALRDIIAVDCLPIPATLITRLLEAAVATASIPFHGEPVAGLQVMGLLETRCLDFDHVLLLSADESHLPPAVNRTSFIPINVRAGYGLTTPERQVQVSRAHFEHLVARCGDFTAVYCNATAGTSTGEPTRFMLQMLAEGRHDVQRLALTAVPSGTPREPAQRLAEPAQAETFSPTALGCYLRCRRKYYYQHVLNIMRPVDISDAFQPTTLGLVFHTAAEKYYTPFVGRTVTAEDLQRPVTDDLIEEALQATIVKEKLPPEAADSGIALIARGVVKKYLEDLVAYDRGRVPFTLLGLEMHTEQPLTLNDGGTAVMSGFIDRLEKKDGVIYVVDYKTGKYKELTLSTMDDVFNPKKIDDHCDYYLQTLLYARNVSLMSKVPEHDSIVPCLLYPQKLTADDYDPAMPFNKQPIHCDQTVIADYEQHLRDLIDTIKNDDTYEPNTDQCRHCDYKAMCPYGN